MFLQNTCLYSSHVYCISIFLNKLNVHAHILMSDGLGPFYFLSSSIISNEQFVLCIFCTRHVLFYPFAFSGEDCDAVVKHVRE